MSYKDIALPLAERGIPTVPLKPRSKQAFIENWEKLATRDPGQIFKWDREFPNANAASVAIADLNHYWFLEVDKPEVIQRIESETGQKIPRTFRVRSSPGRGHFYWKQTPASLEMGNLSQGFVVNGDWSARVDRQYVVSPGSLHPSTGTPYEVVSTAEIIEAPDWLIQWCASQKCEKKQTDADDESPILEGGRNAGLASMAGKLRAANFDHDAIEAALLSTNATRCQPPLPDDEVKTIAASIARYKPNPENTVLIGGKPAGQSVREPDVRPTSVMVVQNEEDKIIVPPMQYPKFPDWVMPGTSIYDGLVKPYCDVNCRYEEFMFMPAMTLLLNYIGTRVSIKQNNIKPSIFLVLIGRAGKVIKSSSVQDAIRYFEYAGMAAHGNGNLKNAEGKTLIWSVGSPEGFGVEMDRLNCKNGVLFYDELSTLTNKASIENSSLSSGLLTLYESGNFQNLIKVKKENFSLQPGTYCASLIACTTDKNFNTHWAKMSGKSSGLNDRFFFLYQREKFLEPSPFTEVSTMEGALKTRKLVDKAVDQKIYDIPNTLALVDMLKDTHDNRAEIRAEKFALGFAVDMGKDEIDEECIERALALVKYERQVKKWIRPFEGATKEATIQLEIQNLLQRHPQGLDVRDLYRLIHPERYGTTLWNQVYNGMIRSGWAREEGTGKRGDPRKLFLLWVPEEEDD